MTRVPLYDALPLPAIGVGSGPANNVPEQQATSSYQWVVAWLVVIILCAAVAQTDIGYTTIYYGLVLILVLLLVTQYKFIATAMAPIGQTPPHKG